MGGRGMGRGTLTELGRWPQLGLRTPHWLSGDGRDWELARAS